MANEPAVASGAASGIDAEQRVKAAVPDCFRLRDGDCCYVWLSFAHRKAWIATPMSEQAKDAEGYMGRDWEEALQYPAVVEFERTHNPSLQSPEAESELCANCSQPIKRCSPWGWHHADGPVLCYNESELVATPLESPEAPIRTGLEEKCGQPAASFIPRWGMSFACVLPKGHDGEHEQGGNCFKHGEYVGKQCPQWPSCAESAVPAKDGFEEWNRNNPVQSNEPWAPLWAEHQRRLGWNAALAASAPEGKKGVE